METITTGPNTRADDGTTAPGSEFETLAAAFKFEAPRDQSRSFLARLDLLVTRSAVLVGLLLILLGPALYFLAGVDAGLAGRMGFAVAAVGAASHGATLFTASAPETGLKSAMVALKVAVVASTPPALIALTLV